MRWHWQKRWQIKGWHVMLTYGQAFAIGIHTGYGWTAMRINGFSILLGPLAFDIQPPMPNWMRDKLSSDKPL